MRDFDNHNNSGNYRRDADREGGSYRRNNGDRPRSYSDNRGHTRRPYNGDSPRQTRPYREHDRDPRGNTRRDGQDKPQQDRPYRGHREERAGYQKREYNGERRSFEGRDTHAPRSYGDRPQRSFSRRDEDRPPRQSRPYRDGQESRSFSRWDGEDRPRNDRSFRNDDRPRREFHSDRSSRDEDRPRTFRNGDRPRREFRRSEHEEVFRKPAITAEAVEETAQLEEMANIQETMLEGRNPIWEALKAGRTMEKLMISNTLEEEGILPILSIARREKIKVEKVPRSKLDELSPSGKHQGMIAMLPAMDYTPLEEMLEKAFATTPAPLFILLDELQDPHNLGAIIRTGDCAGAQGIITLEHRSVGLTSTVAKVSAGALAHMPVAKVTNLVRVIETLQQRGILVVGADAEGESCYNVQMTGPTAIVIGNEGTGIRRLVREQCDILAGIPLRGHVDSLNASVAAAVLIFEAVRQRTQLLQ